jgi:hypothetical protein
VFGLQLSARERRTVTIGLAIVVIGLAVAYGLLPFVQQWREREAAIATQTQQLARLRGLIASEPQLRAMAEQQQQSSVVEQQLLSGRTPALAAATLQSVLQEFANQSRLTVSRLDVAGAPETTGSSLPMIPATVSAIGDIHGVVDMLTLIQQGPHLLEIAELNVRPNSALRGELLQLTITLRAAYLGS